MRSKVEIQQRINEGLVEAAILKMETTYLLQRLQKIARASGAKIKFYDQQRITTLGNIAFRRILDLQQKSKPASASVASEQSGPTRYPGAKRSS